MIGGIQLDKLTPAHVQRLVTETRNGRTARRQAECLDAGHVYKLIRTRWVMPTAWSWSLGTSQRR